MIDGIGPKISGALTSAGITSFDQLYRASEVELREALAKAGMITLTSINTWSKQANLASQGEWKELYKFNAKRKLDKAEKKLA